MSRFPNTISADDRTLAHKMKMAGKKYDRARRIRADSERAQMFPDTIGVLQAHVNRHTLEPHSNNREIARRQRQAGIQG